MADTYTPKLGLVNPELRSKGWGLKLDQNRAEIEYLLIQEKRDNFIHEGVDPSDGGGLNLDITKGVAYEAGRVYYTSSGTIALAASSRNYVYFLQDVLTTSTALPAGDDFNMLAIVKTDGLGITNLYDARRLSKIPVVENEFENGELTLWERGSSQTSSGWLSADRLRTIVSQSSYTLTKKFFGVNQSIIPDPVLHYAEFVFTSSPSNNNYVITEFHHHDIRRYAGRKVCVVFWADVDSTLDMSLEGSQVFGSGGSSAISGIGKKRFTLTPGMKKYTHIIDFPEITDKTIGTYHYTRFMFWMDAGTDYSVRTDGLGSQSGTLKFAHFQIYLSDKELLTRWRDEPELRRLCMPFYRKANTNYRYLLYLTANSYGAMTIGFLPPMVKVPSVTITDNGSTVLANTPYLNAVTQDMIQVAWRKNGSAGIPNVKFYWTADAEY